MIFGNRQHDVDVSEPGASGQHRGIGPVACDSPSEKPSLTDIGVPRRLFHNVDRI